MIDFRYHLVSIVAIFLALGLGIVIGSTALQPTVVGTLDTTSKNQMATIDQLLATKAQQGHQLASDQQFAQSVEPQLLNQLLSGQRVVMVEAPGAPSQVSNGIIRAIQDAGGIVSGQVQLNATFLDSSPGTQSQLQQLAQQFAWPGLTLGSGSGFSQASQVLAGALVTADGLGQPLAGQQDASAAAALSGFAVKGFLATSGKPSTRATLAVVVIPATPPSTNDASAASQSLVTLAQQLRAAGQGTVVAGPVTGSGAGSAIDVMRTGRGGHMSSVDDAGTVIGQIVVAMALAEELRGVTGNYGVAPTAVTVGPSPVPTPSPSPTGSAAATAVPHPTSTGTGKP